MKRLTLEPAEKWTSMKLLLAIGFGIGVATTSAAQSLSQLELPKSPALAPKLGCQDLRSLSGFEFSIDSATSVAGACLVQGLIQPEIRFEVGLPASWNGRLYMFGNGGYAGENLANRGRAARRDAALAKGFASAQTNTGHDDAREPLASFASHAQKLADYAYRAVHVTALVAKQLARAYYQTAPTRAYFDGCSTGGRQGLIAAQRFPDDFDGIVVGAPVLDFTGTMLHYARAHQALAAAPRLREKLPLLAEKIYAKCDALDGAKDGQLEDPRACRFDPAAELTGWSAEELKALDAVYGAAGSFPGFPVGAEAGSPSGWEGWIVPRGESGPPGVQQVFAESFFKHMATPGRELDWRTVDPIRDADKLQAIGALLNATDPDLSRFRARGGKLLMYYGWADPALNPMMGVGYYERVLRTMGASTTGFFRLFMAPGMFHCGGGVGPSPADPMAPLLEWVERGKAPDTLLAVRRRNEQNVRTRRLCAYPQVAKYDGSGNVDDAASFGCAAP